MHSCNFPEFSILLRPEYARYAVCNMKHDPAKFGPDSSCVSKEHMKLHKLAGSYHTKPPTSLRGARVLARHVAAMLQVPITLKFYGRPGAWDGEAAITWEEIPAESVQHKPSPIVETSGPTNFDDIWGSLNHLKHAGEPPPPYTKVDKNKVQ